MRTFKVAVIAGDGTGKSSIYEALYSSFYHKKRLDKYIASNIQETYRNRNFPTEKLEVKIQFDNSRILNRKENHIDDLNILNVEKQRKKLLPYFTEPTIYFANEKVLNRLTKENFYIALNETLFEHFPQMKSQYTNADQNHHFKRFSQFNNLEKLKEKIIEKVGNDITKIRNEFDKIIKSENELLEFAFDAMFPTNEINKILNEYFDENFKISFKITPAQSSNSDILEFNPPIIKIKIDDIECNGKLSQHFNEAKLKLVGVAIYFALAKKYEVLGDGFKLLVLDDFLTSLDMANRKLLMKYILEEFKDYQKLILTHNLQFFNMVTKMIHLDSEDEKNWRIQKLFVHDNKAFLYNKNSSYLIDAANRLENGDLYSAGNFIRKEFEKIFNEFEQLLELGKVEEQKHILGALQSKDKHVVKANQDFNALIKAINNILKSPKSNEDKLQTIQNIIDNRDSKEIDFNMEIDGEKINIKIKKAIFYKNLIFNPSSHHDINVEIYTTECQNGINLLKSLNKVINDLKGIKYE